MISKKIALGSLALLLAVSSGCKDEFFDVNNNPNQVTAATPELVLPNTLANTATYYQTSFAFLNLWMGYWNWSGGYSIATSDKNYQFTNTFNQAIWNSAYTNLKNYNYIEQQAAGQNQPNAQAMAKIMKAFHYQILVDTYGNIPYTNALQGLTVVQPSYDTGTAVYEDLFKQLDAALTLFASGETRAKAGETITNPGANDIMYQGDISKWRRLANTLKLRMILRQSERTDRQAFIQSALAVLKASPYGYITNTEQAATINPGYTNSTNQQNPLYATYGNGVNGQPVENNNIYRAGAYALSFLTGTQDNRRFYFYNPVSGSSFGATSFGTINPLGNSQTSSIGPGVLQSSTQDANILSAPESLFLQAEAVQRGYITGSAKTLYESAVTQSHIDLGVSDDQGGTPADYARELLDSGNANVTWDAATNKLTLILTQKWISEDGTDPFEAWSDFRRTGIPAVPISQDPSTSVKQIPARLLYPQTETQYNETAVKTQGTDSQFDKTRIFWIK